MSDYLLWLLCDADETALQVARFGQCIRDHVTLDMAGAYPVEPEVEYATTNAS